MKLLEMYAAESASGEKYAHMHSVTGASSAVVLEGGMLAWKGVALAAVMVLTRSRKVWYCGEFSKSRWAERLDHPIFEQINRLDQGIVVFGGFACDLMVLSVTSRDTYQSPFALHLDSRSVGRSIMLLNRASSQVLLMYPPIRLLPHQTGYQYPL